MDYPSYFAKTPGSEQSNNGYIEGIRPLVSRKKHLTVSEKENIFDFLNFKLFRLKKSIRYSQLHRKCRGGNLSRKYKKKPIALFFIDKSTVTERRKLWIFNYLPRFYVIKAQSTPFLQLRRHSQQHVVG